MLYENRRRILQIATVLLVAIILITIGVYIFKYLTTGVINVKASDPNDIVKIEQTSGNTKGGQLSDQAVGHLSARVKPGQYEISVANQTDLYANSKVINVKATQNLSFTLNPNTQLGQVSISGTQPEPVYGGVVNGLYSNGSQLLFIPLGDSETTPGAQDGNIMQSSAGGINPLFKNYALTNVKWASSSLGLGEDIENSGPQVDHEDNLFLINNGSINQLSLPFNGATAQLSDDIGKSGNIYLSDGKNVYLGSANGGSFKIIYSTDGLISSVAANNNMVAVVTHDTEDEEENNNNGNYDGSIIILKDTGSSISKETQDLSSAIWSPSGKYLLATSGSSLKIYNTSLKLVHSTNINGSSNFVWYNDNILFYTIKNQVWMLNLQTQQSQIISSLPLQQSISNLVVSSDLSYLYLTENNGQTTQLLRVGLKGQKINQSLVSLGVFLPTNLGSCSLNYLNFIGRPTILINYAPSTTQQACLQLTQAELQTYNLNPNNFEYSYVEQQGD